jgi:hypothetical protein
MRTVTDAAMVAGSCAVVWVLITPLLARGPWFVRFVLYAAAAGATTAAATAVGRWHQHLRPTITSVGVTFGGMCVFWLLVALQRRGRARCTPELVISLVDEEVVPSTDGVTRVPTDTLTRRERRLAQRRRFPVPHRRHRERVDA